MMLISGLYQGLQLPFYKVFKKGNINARVHRGCSEGKELSAPRVPNSPRAGSPSGVHVSIQAGAHASEAHTGSVMLMGRRVRTHKGLITNLRYQTQSALEDQPTEPL